MIHIRPIFPSHATCRQLPQDTQTELDMRQRQCESFSINKCFKATILNIQCTSINCITQSQFKLQEYAQAGKVKDTRISESDPWSADLKRHLTHNCDQQKSFSVGIKRRDTSSEKKDYRTTAYQFIHMEFTFTGSQHIYPTDKTTLGQQGTILDSWTYNVYIRKDGNKGKK